MMAALTPGARAVEDWRRQGATRWDCRRCGKPLGFLLPGRMLTYHAGREIECRGTYFRQVCNACGEENEMIEIAPAGPAIPDGGRHATG